MSEQHENTERLLREALLAEAGGAPAPPDLWTRVQPRLEQPAMPSLGWQRRWGLAAAGAAAALVLAMGGAGAVLIATGLSQGGENPVFLALSPDEGGMDGRIEADDNAWIALPDTLSERDMRSEPGEGAELADISVTAKVRAELAQPAQPQGGTDESTVFNQSGSWSPQGFAGERQIISQASLDLEVSDVNAAATQLRGLVESIGGFIEHVSTSGGPNPEYGEAVVRVPGDRFLSALDSIEQLGKAVGQSIGQQDVTGEAIDLEARLKSELSTEQSLLKLLDRAVSVSDVLTVERELSRVRAEVERLQGQLEFIQRSVALATITVTFVLPPGFTPAAPSASLWIEVDEVERSVRRIGDLVSGAAGTMGRVTISTRPDGQEANLSFHAPASAFDSLLTSLTGDGVLLRREVQSDGLLRQDERNDDLQARIAVQLTTPEDPDLWRSAGLLAAGGALLLLSVSGALALVLRARRRRG